MKPVCDLEAGRGYASSGAGQLPSPHLSRSFLLMSSAKVLAVLFSLKEQSLIINLKLVHLNLGPISS